MSTYRYPLRYYCLVIRNNHVMSSAKKRTLVVPRHDIETVGPLDDLSPVARMNRRRRTVVIMRGLPGSDRAETARRMAHLKNRAGLPAAITGRCHVRSMLAMRVGQDEGLVTRTLSRIIAALLAECSVVYLDDPHIRPSELYAGLSVIPRATVERALFDVVTPVGDIITRQAGLPLGSPDRVPMSAMQLAELDRTYAEVRLYRPDWCVRHVQTPSGPRVQRD